MTMVTLADVAKVDIRLAEEEDQHLPAFDHTYLSNVSTCPTWGVIRYGLHKTMSEGGRAMALEAGSASHEVFAAVRCLELLTQGLPEHFNHHGRRIFGENRWVTMCDFIESDEGGYSEDATDRLNFCLTALHTSGFYDDPRDKRRTLSSIEESCIAYFDKWEWGRRPVWIRDREDPTADVGIECKVEMVLCFTTHKGVKYEFRYTGRADGVHHRTVTDSSIVIHENKTGARIDKTWVAGMRLTHQITGYVVWASTFTQETCDRAMILGMGIPLPKSYDDGGIVIESVARHEHHIHSWLEWALYNFQVIQQYVDKPLSAPRFTNSCTRFFRECSFMPLCDAERNDQQNILDEMPTQKWDPLED